MGFPWPFFSTIVSFSIVLMINKIIFQHSHDNEPENNQTNQIKTEEAIKIDFEANGKHRNIQYAAQNKRQNYFLEKNPDFDEIIFKNKKSRLSMMCKEIPKNYFSKSKSLTNSLTGSQIRNKKVGFTDNLQQNSPIGIKNDLNININKATED